VSKFYEAIRRSSAGAGFGVAQEGGVVANEEASATKEAAPVVVPPPRGFVQGRITRFLQRALEGVPRPPLEPPPELLERLDGVEVQMAALEELVAKRLEEGEGRTLHLVEKRLEVLQEEMSSVARRAVEGQIEQEARALRRLITGIGAFAVGLSAAALVVALGIF
jgi:hypothetical protein